MGAQRDPGGGYAATRSRGRLLLCAQRSEGRGWVEEIRVQDTTAARPPRAATADGPLRAGGAHASEACRHMTDAEAVGTGPVASAAAYRCGPLHYSNLGWMGSQPAPGRDPGQVRRAEWDATGEASTGMFLGSCPVFRPSVSPVIHSCRPRCMDLAPREFTYN